MARRKPRPSASRSARTRPEPARAGTLEAGQGAIGFVPRAWLLAGATALWVARPLFPSEAPTDGHGLPTVMLWIALAVFWLLGVIGQREFRLRFGWVDGTLLLLIAWHTLAALWAARHASARPAVNMLWEWVGFAVAFWLTRQLVEGPRERRAMIAVMAALTVVLAGYGLYQYFYEMPATRAAYYADPDGTLARAGLDYPQGSPDRAAFEQRLASREPMATFALTNSLAGLIVPWLTALAGIVALALPPRKRLLTLCAIAACAVVLAACLLLTKSRSAYLATLAGLVGIGVLWWRRSGRIPWKPMAAAALVLAILVIGVVAAGGVDIEVLSEATKSLGYRGQYWQATAAMIADHPLMGCGPGNFKESYPAYKLPEASEEITDPHNFVLEIWATAGTPAALALAATLVGFFVVLVRNRPAGPASSEREAESRAPSADDRPVFVYGGAALGFLAAVPLGSVGPAPPGLAAATLGAVATCAVAALLWPWVEHGRLSASLVGIGAAAAMVNLSAAGGISYAGVSGSLWLLMAIGLNSGSDRDTHRVPRWGAGGLLPIGGVVAYACFASAYAPVLECQRALRLAQSQLAQGQPSRAERLLQQAAAADPLAVESWNSLASLAFARWKQAPSNEAMQQFEGYTQEAVHRSPNSWPLWAFLGDRYHEAFRLSAQSRYLDAAVAAWRRVAELYPNSAVNRARLALALRDAGDEAGSRTQRDFALRLDQLTPHLDKKLPAELRKSLQRSNSRQN